MRETQKSAIVGLVGSGLLLTLALAMPGRADEKGKTLPGPKISRPVSGVTKATSPAKPIDGATKAVAPVAKVEDAKPSPGVKPPMVVTDAQRQQWPFKHFSKPALPTVKNIAWARTPIDRFILAKLEEKGLKPAAPADRRTLLRRATYDLIGLPPTPEETAAFINDKSPNAYEKVVDRLLASPHYGERWGRHWLDVARYADSNGQDENIAYANAFRYRDYVIAAFNNDKPYNQFVMEQLAGDLMPSENDVQRNERLTATGFLTLGPKVLAEQDKPKLVMDIVDEQIEVTSKAFIGLTVACARCHDHKFDPIPTRDYYALAGIFRSTKTMANLSFVSNTNERPLMTKELQAQVDLHNKDVESKKTVLKTLTDKANAELVANLHQNAAKYLLAGWELSKQPGLHSVAEMPIRAGDPIRKIIEAEKFDRGNANRDFEVYGKGIGIIHTVASPTFAEWDIIVPSAGTYQVEFRYASNEARPVVLSLNGAVIKQAAAGLVTGSFQPEGQKWEPQGIYEFKAGKNTLRIENSSSIPHFDKLLVVATPPASGGAPRSAQQIAVSYGGLLPEVVTNWSEKLRGAASDPVLGAFVSYAKLPAAQFASESETLTAHLGLAGSGVDPAVSKSFAGKHPGSLGEVADRYAALFASAENSKEPGLKTLNALATDKSGLYSLPEKPETLYPPPLMTAFKQSNEMLKAAEALMPKVPMAMAVEEGKAENCRIHVRGSTLNLGAEAPRKFLAILNGDKMAPIDDKRSGRLELAQWIVRPDNPLPSRIEVNRIWQTHFGQGIVRTSDNWGLLGDRPSHPELLDWLASTFIENGWSIKKMNQMIMLSNAYRQSSVEDPKSMNADPDNRLLWHIRRRRLEAEPFRDAILATADKLDPSMGGTLLTTNDNDYVTNDQSGNAAQYNSTRRSVYLPIIRNALYDMFQVFDVGDPSAAMPHRAATTVAPQALYVMNSPFVIEQSRAFAENLLKLPGTDTDRLTAAYRKALNRAPSQQEIIRATGYLSNYAARLAPVEPDAMKRKQRAMQSFCQILFASNEFLYLD